MKVCKFILLILIILQMEGCAPLYRFTNKKDHIVVEKYTFAPVILEDFVICSSLKGYFSRKKSIEVDGDSIAEIFYQALSNTGLKSDHRPSGMNHCDSVFFANFYMRTTPEIKKRIIEIANIQADEIKVVPYIYLDYRYNSGSPGGLVTSPSEQYNKNLFTEIVIYIVKSNKIIYQKSVRHVTRTEEVESSKDPGTPNSQKVWNNLVSMIMEEYVARLEKQ